MVPPNQKPPAGEQWDEAQLEQALRRLKDLHIQMRNLRSTIPRMMEPMAITSSSPEAMFSTIRESTKAAYSEVREYKQLATDEESTKILERAKQSRKDNPKGIKPWRARDDPEWLTPST